MRAFKRSTTTISLLVLGSCIGNFLNRSSIVHQDEPLRHEVNIALPDKNRVCIIGGAGFIGSHLSVYFLENNFSVTVFDKDVHAVHEMPQEHDKLQKEIRHSASLSASDLNICGTVIFLGGCTSDVQCASLSDNDQLDENVGNVLRVARRLSPRQHLIVASAAAASQLKPLGDSLDRAVGARISFLRSMLEREAALQSFCLATKPVTPRISVVRLGSVVGSSLGQRTDTLLPKYFIGAYASGRISVRDHTAIHSFLTLEDLGKAVHSLVIHGLPAEPLFAAWDLASFNSTLLKVATTVAAVTGATIETDQNVMSGELLHPPFSKGSRSYPFRGFAVDSSKFLSTFNVSFNGSLEDSVKEFDRDVPFSITAKGPHALVSAGVQAVPCPVCGSSVSRVLLDFRTEQSTIPNYFNTTTTSSAIPGFSVKLVQCPVCKHYHLSHVEQTVPGVDFASRPSHPLLNSTELGMHFDWLQDKIDNDASVMEAERREPKTILQLGCQEGWLLDRFQARGWTTFGTESEERAARIARSKEHKVRTGAWPTLFPELPRGSKLLAIVAIDSLSFTSNATKFLESCASVMGRTSKLYFSVSQCDWNEEDILKSVFQGSLSFFTRHALVKATEYAGLHIKSFDTDPSNPKSCTLTLVPKDGTAIADTEVNQMEKELSKELRLGKTSNFFGIKLSFFAKSVSDWLDDELIFSRAHNMSLVGYTSRSEGMWLFYALLNRSKEVVSSFDVLVDDMLIDDASYSEYNFDHIDPSKDLVIILVVCNDFSEYIGKLRKMLHARKESIFVLLLLPLPKLLVVDLVNGNIDVVREMPWKPTRIPNPLQVINRTKAVMFSHMRNEELLLPFFIMHHASMFDKVILIDFESEDMTRAIVQDFAPFSWSVVESWAGREHDASAMDDQVMYWEHHYPSDWLLALTSAEFLILPRLREMLLSGQYLTHATHPTIVELPLFHMVGDDTNPLLYWKSLTSQRHHFTHNPDLGYGKKGGVRFMHILTNNLYHYVTGRHSIEGRGAITIALQDAFIMKWQFTPWPESFWRKHAAGNTIPASMKKRLSFLHHVRNANATMLLQEHDEVVLKPQESFCNYTGSVAYSVYRRGYHAAHGHLPCMEGFSLL